MLLDGGSAQSGITQIRLLAIDLQALDEDERVAARDHLRAIVDLICSQMMRDLAEILSG